MIKQLDKLIQKNIRQSKNNNSFKKIIKKKTKELNVTKLSNLSY